MATATNTTWLKPTHLDQHHHHHHHQQQEIQHHQFQPYDDHHHNHDHDHQQHQNMSGFGVMQSSPSSSSSLPGSNTYMGGKENAGGYDLGSELDQELFLYLDVQPHDHHNHHHHHQQQQLNLPDPRFQNQNSSAGGGGGEGMKPPTLNIFPSQPMHVDTQFSKMNSNMIGGVTQLTNNNDQKRPSEQKPPLNSPNDNNNNNNNKPKNQIDVPTQPSKSIKREATRKSTGQEGPKTPDPKTLRRLAQNREAARKSRLRKRSAYVQQLESSRIRLAQLEQELQRARAQGIFFGGNLIGGGDQGIPVGVTSISSDAAVFDLEYTRWLEEHHRLTCELRAALQEHIPENELKIYVDNCLAHHDIIMNLKSMVAKTDVFHLVSGTWMTPAERCFMWIGGFRPSELIKIILQQIEPLSKQQLIEICGLQQSAQGTEEALSQGLEALHQSLSDVIISDSLNCPSNMANYMGQMALAMNKLSTMENFVRQADNLRQQTLHRLHQVLTTQAGGEVFCGDSRVLPPSPGTQFLVAFSAPPE